MKRDLTSHVGKREKNSRKVTIFIAGKSSCNFVLVEPKGDGGRNLQNAECRMHCLLAVSFTYICLWLAILC